MGHKPLIPQNQTDAERFKEEFDWLDRALWRGTIILVTFSLFYFGWHIVDAIKSGRF